MKGKKQRGFTIVEMLAATIVLVLVSLVISVGSSAALRVYRSSLFVSEGELLRETLNTAISDVLRYATGELDGEGQVHFTNGPYGVNKGFFTVNSDGLLCLNKTEDAVVNEEDLELLLNKGSYSGMRVRDFTLSYDNGVFSGGYTIYNPQGTDLERTVTFAYSSLVQLPA